LIANLNLLRLSIADKLCAIEDMLPSDYRLTLVCRHTRNDDAHIVLTGDRQAGTCGNGGAMTELEIRKQIAGYVQAAGSLRNLAAIWKVSPAYLSDVLNGRRAPGPKVLDPIGYKRVKVVTYEPKTEIPALRDVIEGREG